MENNWITMMGLHTMREGNKDWLLIGSIQNISRKQKLFKLKTWVDTH